MEPTAKQSLKLSPQGSKETMASQLLGKTLPSDSVLKDSALSPFTSPRQSLQKIETVKRARFQQRGGSVSLNPINEGFLNSSVC
jgi:hypothetical protein